MPCKALLTGVLTLGVSRGVVTRRSVRLAVPCHALTHPVDKAAKRGDWMGACFLSRFSWLSGQVGARQDALNALVPVPASCGGRRPCAQACRFVRASFRIRRSPFGRAPADSHDALFVFEAMVVVLF